MGANRDAIRIQKATALSQTNEVVLNNLAWENQAAGVVRLPVARAMEIVAEEWAIPGAGRGMLLGRLQKANVPPPNPYE